MEFYKIIEFWEAYRQSLCCLEKKQTKILNPIKNKIFFKSIHFLRDNLESKVLKSNDLMSFYIKLVDISKASCGGMNESWEGFLNVFSRLVS